MNTFTSFTWNHVLIVLLLAFSATSTTATSAANDIVEQTCLAISKRPSATSNLYKNCVTTLNSVPESRNADLFELGVISINLLNETATSVYTKVKTLQKGKDLSAGTKGALNICFDVYDKMTDYLPKELPSYKAKKFNDTTHFLTMITDLADTCEEGFGDYNVPSPFTQLTNHIFVLTDIIFGIVGLIEKA